MVTTRRKSGALPETSFVYSVDHISEGELEEPEFFEDEPPSEEESDIGDESFGRAPPKKKAKTSRKSTSTTPLDPGRAKGKVKVPKGKAKTKELMKTFFDTFPLDVIFEIFSYLHPSDLLRLTRSGKALRSLLMSRKSISIWKSARSRIQDLPDCPPDQSEPQWAHLIFENDCTICGTPPIRKVDWFLRIRGCEGCLKSHLVYSKTAPRLMPHIENIAEVLELLPYSNTGGWAHGHRSSSRFYFTGAIERMSEILDDYQLRVDAGVPGAAAELEKFKERKRNEVQDIVQHGGEVHKWAQTDSSAKAIQNSEMRRNRKAAIQQKLLDLGHDAADVDSVLWSNNTVDRASELTERAWVRIRQSLEVAVAESRTARLRREREVILRPRRAIFAQFYTSFCERSNCPVQGLCPAVKVAETWPEVVALIEQDDTVVNEATFSVLETFLREQIDQWRKRRQLVLLQKMVDAGATTISDPPTVDDFRKLELATVLFRCETPGRFLNYSTYCPTVTRGDDTLFWHSCTCNQVSWGEPDWSFKCLDYDKDSAAAIEAFIRRVGLDPVTTTATELDALDARVYCQSCTLGETDAARTWRNCVTHSKAHQLKKKPWKGWAGLSTADTATIKDGENSGKPSLGGNIRRFICQLCENPRPTERIAGSEKERHLQNKHPNHIPSTLDFLIDHAIAPAPLSVELVQRALNLGNKTKPAKHFGPSSSIEKVYICNRCSHSTRTFTIGGVTEHSKAKHPGMPVSFTDTRGTNGSGSVPHRTAN